MRTWARVVVSGGAVVVALVAAAPGAVAAAPTDVEAPGLESGAAQECAPWELQCRMREAFSGWISQMLADAVNSGLMLISTQLLLIPELGSGVREAWGAVLGVTNTVFVLIVVAAGVVLMAHHSVQTSYGAREALPRTLLGWVGANASWMLCDLAIEITNATSMWILGEAATPEVMTETITRYVNDPLGEAVAFALVVWIAVVLAIVLAFVMLVRLVLVTLVVIVAPLALACHALPGPDGLARLWWRAFAGLLVVQLAQAVVLMAAARLFLAREGTEVIATNWVAAEMFIVIALLYVCVRIPFWAFRRIFDYRGGPLARAAKLAVSYLVLRNLGSALASRSAAAKSSRPSRHPRRPAAASATVAVPPPRRRTVQPELPGVWPRLPRGSQPPLPGIDRQVDPTGQRRLRQQRRYLQPPLPSGEASPSGRYRQEELPGMPRPRVRQDPLPDLALPPRRHQEALFEPTPHMRRPPLHRVPRPEPAHTAEEQRRQPLPPPPRQPPPPPPRWEVTSRPMRPRPHPPRPRRGGRS